MASVLKPFSNMLAPGKVQVPTGRLAIDWSHPLANGLNCAFVPNDSGDCIDLAGFGGQGPLRRSGSSVVDGMGTDGVGIAQTTTGIGCIATIPTGSPLLGATRQSIFLRFHVLGNSDGNTSLFHICWDNANNSPFFAGMTLFCGTSGTTTNGWRLGWNNGGGIFSLQDTTPLVAGQTYSFGGIGSPGSVENYKNGIQLVSNGTGLAGTNGTGPILSLGGDAVASARATNGIVFCGYIWNRTLSPGDMLALHNAPYDFIIPAEYELPITLASAASINVAWAAPYNQIVSGGRAT